METSARATVFDIVFDIEVVSNCSAWMKMRWLELGRDWREETLEVSGSERHRPLFSQTMTPVRIFYLTFCFSYQDRPSRLIHHGLTPSVVPYKCGLYLIECESWLRTTQFPQQAIRHHDPQSTKTHPESPEFQTGEKTYQKRNRKDNILKRSGLVGK